MRHDFRLLAGAGSWLSKSWAALRLDSVIPRREARHGLAVIGHELFAMAGELGRVEAEDIPISEAVHDPARFPHITALHQTFEDVLTLTLPPELLSWAEKLFEDPPVALLETIDARLAHAALDRRLPAPIRRLAEFWLFEAVRVNLVVIDHLSGIENIAASGMTMRDLDRIAAQEVGKLFELVRTGRLERPSLVHAVQFGILHVAAEARYLRTLAASVRDVERMDRMATLEAELHEFEAVDAILLREWAHSPTGKLDPEAVRRKHDVVLGGYKPGALSTRLSRLKDRLERDDPHPPRSSLVDLVRAARGR